MPTTAYKCGTVLKFCIHIAYTKLYMPAQYALKCRSCSDISMNTITIHDESSFSGQDSNLGLVDPHPPRYSPLGCPRNNQIFFSVRTETNRNTICFGSFSVCFAKPKNYFSVCFGVSDPFRNNRNKQICFETNRKKAKTK
jgi:hypothetical protein